MSPSPDPSGFGPDLAEVFGPSASRRRARARPAAHARGRAGRTTPSSTWTSPPSELRGFYRDMVLVRRIDTEATALQRHGELGIWAQLLGQEAAQIGSGRALRPAGLRLPDLPRARRRLVPRRRPAEPARPVPRRRPRRLGPEREQLRPLHDRHRRADAARHRLRDGHAARRRRRHGRPRARRRGDRLLRRRRLQPGRRQRGLHLRRVLQRAGRVLLPEQPVGDLRADRAADPDPALPAGARLRLPRRARRRQRRARRPTPSRRPRCSAPARARARRSSRPTPTGWARTRRPTTRPATGSPARSRPGSSRTRSSGSRPTCAATGSSTTAFFDDVDGRGRRARRPRCARAAARCPTPTPLSDLRPRLRRDARGAARAARRVRGLPRHLRGEDAR